MGSSEESGTNSKLKHVTKDVRESKIYPSKPYQDFSFLIRTKNIWMKNMISRTKLLQV